MRRTLTLGGRIDRSTLGVILGSSILAVGLIQSPAKAQSQAKKPKKAVSQASKPSLDFNRDVAEFAKSYCFKCHGEFEKVLSSSVAAKAKQDLLNEISTKVSTQQMPPKGEKMPTLAERQKLIEWIAMATAADCKLSEPGRVTMRRLNREEYNNTIHDLFAIDYRPADDFPADDVGNGFDNMGDVLSVSPLLMEKYINAAEKVAERVIEIPYRLHTTLGPATFQGKLTSQLGAETIIFSNSTAASPLTVARSGEYKMKIHLYGQQAGPDAVKATVGVDGTVLKTFDLPNKKDHPMDLEFQVPLKSGKHNFEVTFLNDFFDDKLPEDRRDRNLVIVGAQVDGPVDTANARSPSHRRVIPVDPTPETEDASAKKMLTNLAFRAYRAQPSVEDVDRLMRIYDLAKKTGETFERRMQVALTAALVSPRFLYRIESERAGLKSLTSYEMASRLSYFLWSSTPDDQLLELAKANKLQDDTVLKAQVLRMLADPKSHALTDNFGGQWLNLRLLNTVTPDPSTNPGWGDEMKNEMMTETKMFFDGIKRENRSILEFISASYSYLNEDLAKHYGIPGVTGKEFRKVAFTGPERGGVLTQGSILTITSNPTRTSPVKRGKWMLEQILGTPPPPPPPGIPALIETAPNDPNMSVRDRLEMHRKNPACATCHATMDQLGFAFENYGPTGAWRTSDKGKPLDASGVLPGGRKFSGSAELRTILLKDKKLFARNLTDRMLIYALGRGTTVADKCAIDTATASVIKNEYRFGSMIAAVVLSDPFRKRQGETVSKS